MQEEADQHGRVGNPPWQQCSRLPRKARCLHPKQGGGTRATTRRHFKLNLSIPSNFDASTVQALAPRHSRDAMAPLQPSQCLAIDSMQGQQPACSDQPAPAPAAPCTSACTQPERSVLSISTISIPACDRSRRYTSTRRPGSGRTTQLRSFALHALLPDVTEQQEEAPQCNENQDPAQQVQATTPAISARLQPTSSPTTTRRTPSLLIPAASPLSASSKRWHPGTPLEGVPERLLLLPAPAPARTAIKPATPRTHHKPGFSSSYHWMTPMEGVMERQLLVTALKLPRPASASTPSKDQQQQPAASLNTSTITPAEGVPEQQPHVSHPTLRMRALVSAALAQHQQLNSYGASTGSPHQPLMLHLTTSPAPNPLLPHTHHASSSSALRPGVPSRLAPAAGAQTATPGSSPSLPLKHPSAMQTPWLQMEPQQLLDPPPPPPAGRQYMEAQVQTSLGADAAAPHGMPGTATATPAAAGQLLPPHFLTGDRSGRSTPSLAGGTPLDVAGRQVTAGQVAGLGRAVAGLPDDGFEADLGLSSINSTPAHMRPLSGPTSGIGSPLDPAAQPQQLTAADLHAAAGAVGTGGAHDDAYPADGGYEDDDDNMPAEYPDSDSELDHPQEQPAAPQDVPVSVGAQSSGGSQSKARSKRGAVTGGRASRAAAASRAGGRVSRAAVQWEDAPPQFTTTKAGRPASYGDDDHDELVSGGHMPAGTAAEAGTARELTSVGQSSQQQQQPGVSGKQQSSGRDKRSLTASKGSGKEEGEEEEEEGQEEGKRTGRVAAKAGGRQAAVKSRATEPGRKPAAKRTRDARASEDEGGSGQDEDEQGETRHRLVIPAAQLAKDKAGRRKSLAGAGMMVDAEGCRRSSRTRIRPLEYWRNEHKLFAREHKSLPTVVAVEMRTPNPQWPLLSTGHQQKRHKARTKPGRQAGNSSGSQTHHKDE